MEWRKREERLKRRLLSSLSKLSIFFILMVFLMPNVFGATGDNIRITFYDKELHDDSTPADDYTKSTFANAGYSDASVNALNSSAVLRFDGNGDGDLKDQNRTYDPDYDYDLYNHIVIIDQANGDIQFAYKLTEHSTYSNGDGNIDAGEVVTIKGDKYVVTDNKTSDNNIELGPAITKTLTATTVDKDHAVIISGTKAILYGNDGYLYFYDDGSIVDGPVSLSGISSYPYKLTSDDITSDEFKIYKIYVVGNTTTTARVTFVETAWIIKISNDEEGVVGYSSVKVSDYDWFSGGTTGVYFLSDPISLVKGETIALPETYYSLKYTSAKQFDILRKKTDTVANGTKLKYNVRPGEDFLKSGASITVSVVGGHISIEFGANELHDDTISGNDYTKSTFADAGYADASVNVLNSSAVLRFDGNADGDLKDDPDDYDLYNHIVIIDQASGDIQFAYKLTEHPIYSNGDGDIDEGEVVTIKGDKYVVTDNKTSDQDIEFGPAIAKSLIATTVDPHNAVVISGSRKILYGHDGYLYFYDGNTMVETPVNITRKRYYPYKLTYDEITSDQFKPYKIYVISADGAIAKVAMVEKSQLVKFTNDEEGVMGYSSVKVSDFDWLIGGTVGVYFLSDPISLVKGDTIDLPDTYYQLKYTASKQFDILRKMAFLVPSGTTLCPITKPGSYFLKECITLSTYMPPIPPDTTPPIISNVQATSVNPFFVKIIWDTDEPSDSLVKLGLTPGLYTIVSEDRFYVTSHKVEYGYLQSNTTYYYVVNSTDPSGNSNQSNEYSFITPVSLEDRVSALEAELAEKNIEIENLNATVQELEGEIGLLESTVNTLKDFVKKIYDALPEGWKKKIGDWPF